ncbi:MAG: TIGR03619 family F420-dependent LLM class oxidoreductase [Alphaproteobacteria bacterium]|nr:MAG: TIGR03619 family F420-dependent LLM class oxidoreductase [Alphaproteobacteria bacterium]
MTILSNTYGIATRNFTAYPELPDAKALVEYGVRVEELGYDSLWVWDHILLGVEPHFPILDALTTLTAISARTSRILPLRNPVALAKQLSSMDQFSGGRLIMGMASGWYKREFDAMGIPFNKRGKLMDENLEILKRLWTEKMVDGKYTAHDISAAVMSPKPAQPRIPILIGGYVDKVLQRAATAGDGWLTYFYSPESFAKSWAKIRNFANEGGKDPEKLLNASQLPIMIGPSKSAVRDEMMDWLNKEWDFPAHSDCSRESAIMGSIDECVEQLKAHVAVGVQKIIFVPYKYRMDQVETIARDIIPRIKAK